MNIEEARLYLEHTSKDDFNLEEWQKENRYQAIQVVLKEIERLKEELKYTIPIVEHNKTITKHLKEIERLNNIIDELEKWLDKKEKLTFNSWNKGIHEVQRKLQELKGNNKENV